MLRSLLFVCNMNVPGTTYSLRGCMILWAFFHCLKVKIKYLECQCLHLAGCHWQEAKICEHCKMKIIAHVTQASALWWWTLDWGSHTGKNQWYRSLVHFFSNLRDFFSLKLHSWPLFVLCMIFLCVSEIRKRPPGFGFFSGCRLSKQ